MGGTTNWLDRGFYFKLIELLLCLIGSVLYMFFVSFPSDSALDRPALFTLSLAVCNSCITVSLLMAAAITGAQHLITEMSLNLTGGILNVAMGVVLFLHLDGEASASYTVLAVTCCAVGLLMVGDCVRLYHNSC